MAVLIDAIHLTLSGSALYGVWEILDTYDCHGDVCTEQLLVELEILSHFFMGSFTVTLFLF